MSTEMHLESEVNMTRKRNENDLPRIDIMGIYFKVDWPRRELRPEDDRTPPLDINRMYLVHEGGRYLRFIYHPGTRTIAEFPQGLTEFPKDLVLLEIPYGKRLDPVGVAMEKAKNVRKYLKNNPKPEFPIAKVIPWESTRFMRQIEENRWAKKRKVQAGKNKARLKR
ncbi:hypothetical protein JHJ32_07405 [Parapedobacter sp. ISTM3]|uniref:hypothetical protein n=1 Tax=Parapedobacter sp. ISTM3 TaxID=2800130 RepID=UPI0019085CAD|nr:hypothetical protein [Parapedobacter sp. ISTM3]MBK1439804.1 hypothetical protein [Parapedobacter sp. ISTM3]